VTHIIKPSWSEGQRVDFVSKKNKKVSLARGGLALPGSVLNPLTKAKQEASGGRKRAVVDRVIDDDTIRLMLCDDCSYVWASPNEIEALDPVSQLGDILATPLKDGLSEPDDVVVCMDCDQPIDGLVHWMGKEARCGECRTKRLGESDPEFGRNLARAIRQFPSAGRSLPSGKVRHLDVRAGNYRNAASVVHTDHADGVHVVLVGGNYGQDVASLWTRGRHSDREDQIKLLKAWADKLDCLVTEKTVVDKLGELAL
jgi:hypothetical protein